MLLLLRWLLMFLFCVGLYHEQNITDKGGCRFLCIRIKAFLK